MTVWVDSMNAPFGRMKMSHMIADSTEELLAMAKLIGVQAKWLQRTGTPYEHFDISQSKKALAIKHGAVEITTMEMGRKIHARRLAQEIEP